MYSWQSLDPLPLLGEQAGDRWPIEIYGRAASIRAAATQRQWFWTRDLAGDRLCVGFCHRF